MRNYKTVSLLLIVTLIVSPIITLQTENAAAAEMASPPVVFTSVIKNSETSGTILIPATVGKILKQCPGDGKNLVVLIQNAHANEEAQKNIAEILRALDRQRELEKIYLEGAEGQLFKELFTTYPSLSVRQPLADYFLKIGRLTGPEYFAMTGTPSSAILIGVEDRHLYEQNRNAYVDVQNSVQRNLDLLDLLEKRLDQLSRFIDSRELRLLRSIRRSLRFNEGLSPSATVDGVRRMIELARATGLKMSANSALTVFLHMADLEA